MTPALLAVAALGLVGLLVLLPLPGAFVVFAGSLVLVPDTLRFPAGGAQMLLVRILPVVFLVGLARRSRRGELPAGAFRPSPATVGLVGLAVVAWVIGVMGAEGPVPPTFGRDAWLVLPEQLLVLIGATAAVRAIGSLRAVSAVASVAAAGAAIAVSERLTRHGYAQRIFSGLPEQRAEGAGGRLELRSGAVRPRVATRFSLAYAWQATMLLPATLAAAAISRRTARFALTGLLALAVALTASRSAYAGMALGLVGFAVLSRRRVVILTVATALAVGALVAVGSGLADNAFSAPEASGSNAVRDERSPVVLDAAADDPFTGLGYGALLSRGLPTTDSSWLQLYAELGVVGLCALGLSIAFALAGMVPALTASTVAQPQRLVAAGCTAGVGLSLVGAAYFDLFTGRQSVLILWVLVAVGVVAGEEAATLEEGRSAGAPARALGRLADRPLLPALGLALGAAVFALGPRPAAAEVDLQLVPAATDALATGPGTYVGRTLAHTTCDVLEAAAEQAGADATCFLPFGRGPGWAHLRVASDDPDVTRHATDAALAAATERVQSTTVLHRHEEDRSVPAPVRTAPLTGAAVGVAAAVLLPERRTRHDRRSRAASVQPASGSLVGGAAG
ncbi:MAG TPA: O-antigen ligase family protein [Acidimicrobiales bacterium]|nr:O-antigen ligase family protein [Acidimicrobiales bacterium]